MPLTVAGIIQGLGVRVRVVSLKCNSKVNIRIEF